jgi:hypothetical protein
MGVLTRGGLDLAYLQLLHHNCYIVMCVIQKTTFRNMFVTLYVHMSLFIVKGSNI